MTQATVMNSYPLFRFYDETLAFPLSDSPALVLFISIAYLAYVLIIGPMHMKNRKPYSLKNLILGYNAIQVILSMLFVILGLRAMFVTGLMPKKSPQLDPETRSLMFVAVYMYFLGKITELVDTIFFILRKKYNQVSFLHVYHHTSAVIGTWIMVFYGLSMTCVYTVFINSFVHVVMYFYYFMSALGPEYQKYITWKKHITTFQLVQFVSIFLHQLVCIFYTEGEHALCSLVYAFFTSALFFVLFYDFYKKTYNKRKDTKKNVVEIENSQNSKQE